MRNHRVSLFIAFMALLFCTINAAGRQVVSLHGPWAFSIETTGMKDFMQPDFDASGWSTIPVPSHWEFSGFGTRSYRYPSDEVGLYRKTFTIPEDWKFVTRVFVHFESVYSACTIYLNGKEITYHQGAHHPFNVELTEALNWEGENLLALRVVKKTEHFGIDDGDFWQLGGIYRRCELFAIPARTAITDYLWQTPPGEDGLTPSGEVVVHTTLEIRGAPGELQLKASLFSGNDMLSASEVRFRAEDQDFSTDISFIVSDFKTWNAEYPNIYRLRLALYNDEKLLQEESCTLGFRVVVVRNGVLLLNGVAIKLRGTGTLDIWPEVGRSVTREMYEKDVQLMKEANINTLRPGWAGMGRDLLEVADKEGLYILGEIPFANVLPHSILDDPAMIPAFLSRTKESVKFLKNHPSVIFYSVGNENGYRTIHPPCLDWIRKEDSSRPILVPKAGWASYPDADIVSFHYSGMNLLKYIEKMNAKEIKKPLILTEFCHGLWNGGGGLERMWEWMNSSPLVAGGCQFAWCDQGIRYKKDGEMIIDTQGVLGSDGLVHADRTPKPQYFQARQVYCPVRILEDALYIEGDASELTVLNRHDFTDLSDFYIAAEWQDGKDGFRIGAQTIPLLPTSPHASSVVSLRIKREYRNQADFLKLVIKKRFDHKAIGEKTLRVSWPPVEKVEPKRPAPYLDKIGDDWRITANGITWTLDAKRVQLISCQKGRKLIPLSGPVLDVTRPPFPHLTFRRAPDTLMDEVRPLQSEVTLLEEINTPGEVGGRWQVDYIYMESVWPDFIVFRDCYRITVDKHGGLNLFWSSNYHGRTKQWIRRWGVELGIGNAMSLLYHGRGPNRSFPDKWAHQLLGSYQVPLVAGKVVENRQDTDRILAQQSSSIGMALTLADPCGMRVEVDQDGMALISLAAHVQGLGNKGGQTTLPTFRVIPSEVRTATGAVRLTYGRKDWWTQPKPTWPNIADGDSWPVELELAGGTSPLLADSDGDGLLDEMDPYPLDPDLPNRRMLPEEEMGRWLPPELLGEHWVWIEGESITKSKNAQVDISKAAQTSGGKCLGGFREEGDYAVYAFRIDYPIANARLVLRYARQDHSGAYLGVDATHSGGTSSQWSRIASTSGWGKADGEWGMMEIELGTLQPGPVMIELTAKWGPANLNLDGFYLLEPGMKAPRELKGGKAQTP
jgi:beta-galactosidase